MKTFKDVFKNMEINAGKEWKDGDSLKNHLFDGLNVDSNFLKAYGKDLDRYADHIEKAGKNADKSKINIDGFNEALARNGKEAVKTTTFMQDVGNGIKSFGKTALSMATNAGIDLLISGAFQLGAWGIDKIINAQSDAIERGNKSLEEYNNLNQKLSTTTSWVDNNSTRYAELAKGVSYLGENISLTSADYEEYQQLSQQIAQQFPDLVTGYNSLGQPIIGTAKSVNDLNQALKDQKYTEYSKALKNAGDVTDKIYEEVFRDKNWAWQDAGAQKQLDALNEFRDTYNNAMELTGSDKHNKLFGLSNFQMDNNFVDALDSAGVSIGDFLDLTNDLVRSEGNLEAESKSFETLNTIMSSSVDLQSQIDQATDSMRSYLPLFIQANKDYQDLAFENPELENQITALTRGFSLEDMQSRNFFDKDDGVLNIKKWANDAVTELKNPEMQQALSDVFTINDDKSKKSFGQWRQEADDALDKAATKSESLTGAWGREQMRQASGIADEWERLRKIQDDISAKWGDKSFGKDARNNLSIDDFETLGTLALDDSFDGTYQEAVNQINKIQRQAEISLSAIQKTVTDAQTNLSSFQSAINESASATGLSAESITAVGNAFSEFSELNPALLFTNTANGVKVNNKALSSLISLQHKVKSKDFSDAIKNQTQAIAEQNEVVKNASEDNLAEEQGKLQNMFGDLSAIQQARSQYNALYQEQQKLFSDYGEWVTATSTENAGDPFLNMVSGLEQAKAAYDKGLVGTDEFKSFAKLISPTGATDAANFMENYGKAARYLTEDISGVQNFLSDLQTNGFAEYNAELDSWALNVRNVSDVAKKMGMGEDFISGMFGRLEDYGFHNNIINDTEDGVLKLSDAYRNLAESQSRLDKLKSEDPGNTTAIEAAEKEVQGYQQDIDELGTNLSNVAADSASAYNEELESAKDQIKILGKEYENIFKNDLYGENQDAVAQYIQDMIDGLANTYDLDSLDFEQIRQDAENYRKSLSGATIENPAEIDFGDDIEKANTYASALGKVQQANKDNKTVIEETKNALSDFTSEQIKSIDLFDGAYDSNQLEPAEKALDSLVESLGLTNEEAEMLPQLLEATGMIKPEVDTSDIEKAATEGENAQKSLEEATGKTYDFDFNTTDLDTIQKQMDTVTSDMAQYQTTDANGNVTYDYSQPGANETAKVYESTVRQQQAAEFSNTELGKNEATGGTLDTAVRAYQEAKNELDTQTLLSQQGVKNDVEGATKACNEAFQAVKDAGGEEIFDTTGIQELDDSIKNMTDKEYKAMVDVDADTINAENSISDLKNLQGSSWTLDVDVTGEENVEQTKQIISSMPPNTSTTVNVEVNGKEDADNTISLIESAPKNQNSVLTVTVDGDDPEELNRIMEAANAANAQGANVVVQVEGEIGEVNTSTAATPSEPIALEGKISHIDTTADYQPVALEGNITNIDTTGNYQPIALKGNIVQLEGTPSDPVNVVGNITDVTGGEGKTIEVIGHIATVTGGNGKMINVIGNITSVTGGESASGTINYEKGKVDKADGTVSTGIINYKKGDVEKADGTVSTGIINYNLGSVADAGSPVATGTINYVLGSVARPGGATVTGTMSTGSMLSPSHVNGTAYNVLNMRPLASANALGNVTIPKDQVSLTNEVGQESIVRNGVWSLLPGGAHLENLKKGDIVFNASQTKALLEHGRMAGHARAYADGTLSTQTGNRYGLYKAYRGGSMHGSFQGGAAGGSSSGGGNSHTTSYNNNTGAVNSNTKATNDNTKAAKKSTQVFDWVERRLKYFADKTKAIADSINDYISFSQKKSLLQKQIYATNSEMHVNYRAARAYYSKAQSLGLSSKTRKLIEEGRYTLDDIDTSTESGKAHYDKVQKYMNYYDEYTKCIDAVRELRNEQVELYAQWAAIPTEEAEKKIDKLTQSYNGLAAIQARLETAGMGGSAQALLMKQLDNTMRYANNNKKKTDAEFNKQKDRLHSIQNKEDKTKKAADADKKSLNSATNALKKGASLTEAEKKRVNSGLSLSTKGLKGKKKTLVEKYNAALKKSNSSKKAYQNAVSYGKGVREDHTAAKDAKHTNDVIYLEYKKNWEAAKKAYDKGDSLSYQNYLVDQELALLKQQNDAKNTAYRKANQNTQTATKRKDNYKSKLDSVKKKGKSYSKKYAKYLTAEQEKQLAAGKKINTDNIKNANVKKIIDQYNIDLQNAMNSYTAATQQLTAAQEAEAEAAANAAQSQAEYAQAQVEAEKTKFDNIKKYYEQRIEYQESWNKLYDKQREYDKTHGDYTTSESFDKPINEINKAQRHQEEAAKKLQEQLNKAVKAGTIKEYSDEWLEMKAEIVDAQTAVQDYENQMEQLKQEQILVQYEEMFDRAIEKAEKFKDKIEAINSLITEEMMYDYETGHLTEFGALSIVLNAKQLDTSLTTLKDYVKKRQQIMDDFKADKFGEETYDKLMAENDASLQGALKDAQAYQQAIIGIIKDQAQAEQDALFKVIDARKDALKKKKDYYDYDKTIKNKSKEINLLKQQIAALDGVTDAQSRAEKARLEAELAEKQEDFDDTVRDHVYELQVDGLDDLKDQLSEDFEKWSHELSANLDKMSQAIADAVANVGGNTADALNSIAKILEQFGINAGDMGITQGDLDVSKGESNQKSSVPPIDDSNIVRLNHVGGQIMITENGISTPMSVYDGMIPNDITEMLINMSMENQRFPLSELKMPEIKVTGGGNTNVNIQYDGPMLQVQGDVTKSTLPDLQTILKKANTYTQNEIRKNMKRFG